MLYGYANALRLDISFSCNNYYPHTLFREAFCPEISTHELPAHHYQRSIHNIVVERSWLRMRLTFGDTAVLAFQEGETKGLYNPQDPKQ